MPTRAKNTKETKVFCGNFDRRILRRFKMLCAKLEQSMTERLTVLMRRDVDENPLNGD